MIKKEVTGRWPSRRHGKVTNGEDDRKMAELGRGAEKVADRKVTDIVETITG